MIKNSKINFGRVFVIGKSIITVLSMACTWFNVAAQDLEYLPPVINAMANHDTNTSIIVATIDNAKFDHKPEEKPYITSVQIIDADRSWPPRWYTAKPVYTKEMFAKDLAENNPRIDFMESPLVENGSLSYVQVYTSVAKIDPNKPFDIQHSSRLMVLNKEMRVVDSTANSRSIFGGSFASNYKNESEIKKLKILRQDSIFDLRRISGNNNDSAVDARFFVVQALDRYDTVIFAWNPVYHLDPKVFRIKEQLAEQLNPSNHDPLRIMKFGNASWDYDGNILYSILKCGIGKISSKDGHVIWQYNFVDMPVVSGSDTFECYSPADIHFLYGNDSVAIYSFFEKGGGGRASVRGVAFEQDKRTLKMKVLNYISPEKKYQPTGQGGFDYIPGSGSYLIDYGIFEDPDSANKDFWSVFEYGKNNTPLGIFKVPKWNFSFGAHFLQNWPRPPRPVIIQKGNLLEATGDMQEWTWYKLEGINNTVVTKVGNGAKFNAIKNATYCVAGLYGIGYAVSKPFIMK